MKKLIHKIISVICSGAMLAANMPVSAQSGQSGGTVYISDTEGFLKLAGDCRIDTASKNLTVILTTDISLDGNEFFGIPIFCGTFDGDGHTISGLSIHDSASEMGLFRHVERGAVIKNLTVKGTVSPSGSGDMVGGIVGVNCGTIISCKFGGSVSGNNAIGGIAGKNEETGVISGCESSAAISAESSSGGIVGTNSGVIIDCFNSGKINTVYVDKEISAEELDLENLENMSANNVIGKSDIGGIAGFSSGIIQRCTNSGTVGYQHTGYNIGGIVGRQNGMISSCKNTGSVFGRKDVGGIAGQMEPYRSIEFSEDTVQQLGKEMDILSESVDKLISDARDSGGRINSEIQKLTSQMNAAQKNADEIADRTESVLNGYSEGINELLARADIALDGMVPALNSLDSALELLGDFSHKCAEALNELEQAGANSSAAAEAAREALKDMDKALPALEAGLRDISNAVLTVQRSLGDPEQVKRSLGEITKSLDGIADSMKDVSDAARRLNNALRELSDWLNGSDWQELKNSASALSDCLADVLSALGDMSGAVGDVLAAIDSDGMNEALSELNTAAASLGKAAADLAAAIGGGNTPSLPDNDRLKSAAGELQNAADALQQASDHLAAAVDPDEMQKALDELEQASRELEDALARASDAAGDMSGALDRITSSEVPENTMNTVSAQIDRLLDSLGDISEDLSKINKQLRNLLDEIDASGLSYAMGDIANAAGNIADAAGSIGDSGNSVDSAVKSLGEALGSLTGASSAAGDAAEILSQMSDKLSEAAKQLEAVTSTLAGKPEIRFPALDDLFTAAADDLSENMKAMISTLSRISSIANAEGNALLDDVQEINDCLSRIFGIFKDTYKDLLSDEEEERGFSEDISESETDSAGQSRRGKVLDCANSGIVEGDVNVGGITGSMAIEFDLDPEDDITLNGDRSVNFSYNVMDIIESCENSGRITAKKNYCGGIVGKMDMGLVINSLASGTVSADSGSYVGGIAGYSSAKLRSCRSKVTLSGVAYIGGIAGEGGIITDCLSISDITEFSEKIGALAGYVDFSKKNTEIERNFFVDRGVAGIDRVSYAGIAEPMSYSEFARLTGDFADIVIEFTADGETLAKLIIPYGGSVKASDIPEIPQKSGFYARWNNYGDPDNFDFENITFPRVLEAEYIQLLTSVGSDKKSEQGLPLVLADGSFDDAASVKIETESSSIFAPEGSELRIVTINSDSAPTALRFLKTGDNPRLMQYINGAWKAIPFTENGSYLIIENPSLENGIAAFCVSGGAVSTALIIITAAAAAAGILAVTVILILLRKNKSKKQKKHN